MTTPTVYVIYHSFYGHTATLAKEIAKGLKEAGCNVELRRAPETLSEEIRAKMHAPPLDTAVPEIDVHDLPKADGIMFGMGTRFGMAPTQMKTVLDATGQLWQTGALVGIPAGIFTSTATLGGGQETTALTFITQLAHHGMIFVPMGYSTPLMFGVDEVRGGSAYGCGTIAAGDGSRQPSELELKIALHHGKQFGGTVKTLAAGKAKLAGATAGAATTTSTTSTETATPKTVEKIEGAKKLDGELNSAPTSADTTTAAAATTPAAAETTASTA